VGADRPEAVAPVKQPTPEITPRATLPVAARALWSLRRTQASVRVVRALVQPGDIVADIGASWGLFTHAMSRGVGSSGHVHAFEPNPASVKRLTATCHWRTNVTIHPHALSDEASEGELYVPHAAGRPVDALASLSPPVGTADLVRVPLLALDAVLNPETIQLSLIKCDVEGHEDHVLAGARGQLERWHPALLVELEQRHRDAPIETTFSFLARLGYEGYFLDRDGPRPLEQFDIERHQLRFLTGEMVAGSMPDGYVHDFLFVAHELPISFLQE
jgi:FkbM family methyltransferase